MLTRQCNARLPIGMGVSQVVPARRSCCLGIDEVADDEVTSGRRPGPSSRVPPRPSASAMGPRRWARRRRRSSGFVVDAGVIGAQSGASDGARDGAIHPPIRRSSQRLPAVAPMTSAATMKVIATSASPARRGLLVGQG
jgi:hypothetical protein